MNNLILTLRDDQTEFRPGDQIDGQASWSLDISPPWIEVRLFWYTEGKGTQDVAIIDTARFEQPGAKNTKPFHFQLPESPYSFSGKLISLCWALELVAESVSETARADFTVSPTGQEISLAPEP